MTPCCLTDMSRLCPSQGTRSSYVHLTRWHAVRWLSSTMLKIGAEGTTETSVHVPRTTWSATPHDGERRLLTRLATTSFVTSVTALYTRRAENRLLWSESNKQATIICGSDSGYMVRSFGMRSYREQKPNDVSRHTASVLLKSEDVPETTSNTFLRNVG